MKENIIPAANEKEPYVPAELEIVAFETEDIITVSKTDLDISP